MTCIRCGADLGDAEDPHRDPDCLECLHRDIQDEAEHDMAADPHTAMHPTTRDDDYYGDFPDY